MHVEIWSDVVCPWCYVGKRRFESALARFEHADEVEVRWRSFELDPAAPPRRSGSMAAHLAAKYHTTVEQAEAQLEHMNAMGRGEGLAYDLARTQSGNTFDAHRLIHLGYSVDAATGAALKETLLHAYFEELRPIGDPEVLVEVAVGAGLDEAGVREMLASDRFADAVRRDEREASELGCTGVPFFVIDRVLAVPGAQDADTFLAVLQRAWERSHRVPEVVVGGAVCTDEACAVPGE